MGTYARINKGDEVVDVRALRFENVVMRGTVKAKYGDHYLVSYPDMKRRRGGHVRHCCRAALIRADSTDLPKLIELSERYHALETGISEVDREIAEEWDAITGEKKKSSRV